MRKVRNQKIKHPGILLSYDPYNDGYEGDHGWLDALLDENEAYYGNWPAKDAWKGMKAFIYEKKVGIVAAAQIVKPMSNDEDGIIGAIDKEKYPFEIRPPISQTKLQEKKIITLWAPRRFHYLSERDVNQIENLLDIEIKEIEDDEDDYCLRTHP
jgi:hypothetical protein